MPRQLAAVATELEIERIADDRENLQPDDAVLLIVEDDPHYARVLCDLVARQRIQGPGGDGRGGSPRSGSRIPSNRGFAGCIPAGHAGLDRAQPSETGSATRHIPVQMLTLDEDRHHGLTRGAFAFVTKPTTPEGLESALNRIKEYTEPRRKRLLVVEDNPAEQLSIRELLGHDDIDISVVDHRRRSSGRLSPSPPSTASCSICVFRICRASRFWNACATLHR